MFCNEIFFTFVNRKGCRIEKKTDIMKDRIAHIMRAKNLKASDFAASLGIQPSAVSHILTGRNKPSLEFVKKIKETFPEYNLDWIVFGTGPMTTSEPFKESPQIPSSTTDEEMESLFDSPSLFSLNPSNDNTSSPSDTANEKEVVLPLTVAGVKTIVFFYEDGSFETFHPKSSL